MATLFRFNLSVNIFTKLAIALLFLLTTKPALAHHPFGGETPTNFFEGLLSGLGHPVIGIDHLAFVVAVGLVAATKKKSGIFIPVALVLATLGGTGIHLLNLDLPAPEIIISASVLLFGIALSLENSLNSVWLISTSAVAGIFHGYAYGEAIVGAEMTPLVAYLSGFALIQLAIALVAFAIGRSISNSVGEKPSLNLRFAGFTIVGAGLAFLATSVLG